MRTTKGADETTRLISGTKWDGIAMEGQYRDHVDELIGAVTGVGSQRDPIIFESWKRCIDKHGLDPTVPRDAFVMPTARMREHRDAMGGTFAIVHQAGKELLGRIAKLGHIVLATDANAVTVDFVGQDSIDADLRRAGLCVGADWRETFAGTCAVGTAIATGKALTVHQSDHFNGRHMRMTCTAAPVFHPDGSLAAIINASALDAPSDKASQKAVYALVRGYALKIESASLMSSFQREWLLHLSSSSSSLFVGVDCGALVAIGADGRICGFNSGAKRLLEKEVDLAAREHAGATLLGSRFEDLFEARLSDLPRYTRGSSPTNRSLRLKRSRTALHVLARMPETEQGSRRAIPKFSSAKQLAGRITGGDRKLAEIERKAIRLATTDLSILLNGPTGSGKEHLARFIHAVSNRKDKPFVAVNCAAMPEQLVEAELFGYAPGSFTGASPQGRKGLVLEAEGGTLFLDEIGDMPLSAQTRLLRVLAEREVTPIGRTQPIPIDICVLSATHRDLREYMKKGSFREDLFYRLSAAEFRLPPLCEREDLEWLVEKVLRERAALRPRSFRPEDARLSAAAHDVIVGYRWPGNVRELCNALDYGLAMTDDGQIQPEHLPENILGEAALAQEARVALECGAELESALAAHHGNVSAVARELGVDRSTIHRKMRRFSIKVDRKLN